MRRGVRYPAQHIYNDLSAKVEELRELVGGFPDYPVDSVGERVLGPVRPLHEPDKSVYYLGDCRGELGDELALYVRHRPAEAGEGIVELRLCLVCRYERRVIFLENIGRVLICAGERVGNEGRPLGLVRTRGELFVKLVLGDTDPIQRVGKCARDLSDLCGLVRRFYEAVYRESVAKRTRNPGGNIRPCSNVLFRGRELCEKLRGLRSVIRIPQNGVKGLIRLLCGIRGVSRRLKRGI